MTRPAGNDKSEKELNLYDLLEETLNGQLKAVQEAGGHLGWGCH